MAFYQQALGSPNRAIDHFSAGWVDASGSRTRDVFTYQNGSLARLVAVRITGQAGGSSISALVGAASPAGTIVAHAVFGGTENSVFFLVPPNWFYGVDTSGDAGTVAYWRELEL